MMVDDIAKLALDTFARRIGIDALRFDQSGTALLAFGERQELIFYSASKTGEIEVWSPLTDVTLSGHSDSDAALMQHVLEQNFPASNLGGAYFAVDGEMGVVLLGSRIAVDRQNINKFGDAVIRFAEQVMAIETSVTEGISESVAARAQPAAIDAEIPVIKG